MIQLICVAPILKDISIEYETIRFNGSLLKANAYRGDPGPETDAAWDALGIGCKSVLVHDAGADNGRPESCSASRRSNESRHVT